MKDSGPILIENDIFVLAMYFTSRNTNNQKSKKILR